MLDSMSVNIMNLPKTVVKFFSDYFQGQVDYDKAKSNFETAIKERYPDITEVVWPE